MTKKTDIRARESFTDSVLNSTVYVYLKERFLNHILEVEKEVDKELAIFLLKHVHSNV
jgi:hypothetical protein